MKFSLPLLLIVILWSSLSAAAEFPPVVVTTQDGTTHVYFPDNASASPEGMAAQVDDGLSVDAGPPIDDSLPVVAAPDPNRDPDEKMDPLPANPKLVVDKDGNQKVEIFGEIRDKSEIGIDVDGDKITEMVDDKLRKTRQGESLQVVMHVNKAIDNAVLEAAKRIGAGAKINAVPEGFIYVTATEPVIRRLAALPFIDEVQPNWPEFYTQSTSDARSYSGTTYSLHTAQNFGKPIGPNAATSPINGDSDQSRTSFSPDDSVIAIVDSGIHGAHEMFHQAIGAANGVVIIPPNPTPSDDIFVTVYGIESSGCTPRAEEADVRVDLSRQELHIDFPSLPPNTYCTLAITPYATTVRTQTQLPKGTYDVIVTEGDFEVLRSSFTVGAARPSIAVDSRRVACSNERTGTTVVVKDRFASAGTPDDFRDCKAKGWKALNGDKIKIQQTVTGTARGQVKQFIGLQD